ncbi:LuxR C-terminal-related transcriptional regulator [Acinetobacter sp. MB5]|uniref:LuxR C-terminal-related transcriptional regulator n=1 Tax=Acinetobacter sp. MB5 TaxID=2069438 RepID=UPI000DCFECF8|nr:LuxR C-terminal-related transcriptional regulator [Acinetobacter sp. MB5]
MKVLKTKLSRPSIMNEMTMQRPQLLKQMLEYCHSSLVFIHAAAGYGKTTLMYQLSESLQAQGKQTCWLTLDSDDNDPIRLYQYLWAALLSSEHHQPIPEGQIYKQNVIELAQHVAELDHDIVIFIDEFEVLTNPDCLNILWWLYQYLPNNGHMVIASRVKPYWSFTKEFLLGRLKFVTEGQLSVKLEDRGELIQFLQQQNFDHLALSDELAQLLIEKTEGWITGIQLTNLYLKNDHDAGAVIQSLSGAHNQIVDYLSEQVFMQLSEDMRDFILKISILRKLSLPVVSEVTQNPAANQCFDAMIQKGLFLQALDEQHAWYRIHHLFRDFLEMRFKQFNVEAYKAACSRAAYWFKQNHYLMEAIYYAQLAQDQTLVLALLQEVSRTLILEGRIYTLLELVKQIPEQSLVQHGELLYDITWSLIITHQNARANHYLQLWQNSHQSEALPLRDDQLSIAPMLALLTDHLEQAYQLAQQNISKLSETAYFVRAPLIGIGALYHIAIGQLTEARKILIKTRATYIQGHNAYGLIFTDCVAAACDYLEGNIEQALEKCNYIGKSEDYSKLSSDDVLQPMILTITSSMKAFLYYELNQLEQAEQTLQSFNGGEQLIIPDLAIIGYELQLRLAHLQGHAQAEQECLTQVQIRTQDWSMPRLTDSIQRLYDQFQWFHAQEKLAGFSDANIETLCRAHLEKSLNLSNVFTGDDLGIYRELIFTGKEHKACELLELELKRIGTYLFRSVRILFLMALAQYRLDQREIAFNHFEQALILLEPTKVIRIVLDEHPLLIQLLADYAQHLQKSKKQENAVQIAFTEQLCSLCCPEFAAQPDSVDVKDLQADLLSKREVQILQKVSQGCTDIELADQVFLSVNTVKWHLRNIYNKLGVRSRLEAVTEAKKLGLID